MLLKWVLLGTLLLTSYISFAESSVFDEFSHITNNNEKDGIFHKVWFTFSDMAQKFVEKLKSLLKIIPFFHFSDSNEDHTMKISKIMDKVAPIQKENQEKSVLNLMNGVLEGAKKNSDLFRFKRHAGRGRNKRRRSGDEEEDEYNERGDDAAEEEKAEEEKAAARRRRRRRVRGKGRRRY